MKNKTKRIGINVSQENYDRYKSKADELEMSLSSFCCEAVESSLGKIKKVNQKTLTIEPIDIYTDDITEAINKFGSISTKLNRLLYTLSIKESAADYEMKRLYDLTLELKEAEREFGAHIESIYNDRAVVCKKAVKLIKDEVRRVLEE